MKKFSKVYTALIVSGAMFGAESSFAQSTDVICSTPNGCDYGYLPEYLSGRAAEWVDVNNDSQRYDINGPLNVVVEPGLYKNVPRNENGNIEHDGVASRHLFGIWDTAEGRVNILRIRKGVVATLREDYAGSSILSVSNTKATIEKGVSFIVEKNYSQIHNDPNRNGDDGDNAIYARDNSEIETEADIILNNDSSTAIYNDGAEVYSNNHSIKMNGKDNLAYELYNKGKIQADNVTVIGDREGQTFLDIGTDNDNNTVKFIGSNLNVDLKNKLSAITLYSDISSSNLNLKDSSLNAEYGFLLFPFEDSKANIVSLDNTRINTRKALISINDENILPLMERDDEDFLPSNNYQLDLTVNNQSVLKGAIIINEQIENSNNGFINLTLNNSQWLFDKNSQLTNLSLNNGEIISQLNADKKFSHLTVSNLSGTGTFALNTDLASQQSDKIIVKGTDSGDFGLVVTDSGNEPQAENGKVTLVETQTGTAQFRLKDREYVDAGAYRYRLYKEGNDWVLSNRNGERGIKPEQPSKPVVEETPKPVAPVTPTIPSDNTTQTNTAGSDNGGNSPAEISNQSPVVNTGNTSSLPNQPAQNPNGLKALSERTNAKISLRQAQLHHLEQSLSGLHQRLGELKQGETSNVWARHLTSRSKLGAMNTASDSRTSGFKQDYYALQVGADTPLNEVFRLGAFVGTARSNVDFNGDYGSGKLNSQAVGLYGTFQFDNGLYMDNIAKYERLTSQGQATEKRRYNGYSLSSEVGRSYALGQGWTVTPQLQLAWSHLSAKADEDRLSALYARLGVRVAKTLDVKGWALQPYAEVNGISSKHRHSQVRVNQYVFDVASTRGRIETAFGITAGKGNHRVGIEAKTTQGKHLDQPFAVQANYRYSW